MAYENVLKVGVSERNLFLKKFNEDHFHIKIKNRTVKGGTLMPKIIKKKSFMLYCIVWVSIDRSRIYVFYLTMMLILIQVGDYVFLTKNRKFTKKLITVIFFSWSFTS